MTSVLKVDTIQNSTGTAPTVGDLGISVPRWHVTLVTDITGLTDATTNLVQLDTVNIDTESGFNTSTHHYTIPQTGTYMIYHQVIVKSANATVLRDSASMIEVSTDSGTSWEDINQAANRYSGNDINGDTIYSQFMYSLSQGDLLRFRHYLNTTDGSTWTIGHDARLLTSGVGDAPGTGTYFGGYRIA
jgi:hypothetical protein